MNATKAARRRGFTLLEMVMAAMVLSVLTASAVPAYFNSVRSARTNAANVKARAIATAVQSIYTRNGSSSYTGLNLSNSTVLKELANQLPVNDCAATSSQSQTGGWIVTISTSGDTWTIAPRDASLCKTAPETITLGGS